MEVFVTLNAVGGILTFLGIRWSVRKAKEKMSRDDQAKEGDR